MKNKFIFILFLFTYFGYSQQIRVNTSTYTANQLVNQVLINSGCASATNVLARTGIVSGSTNGIGYFENNLLNPTFPFAKGVVLTTGNVLKVPGPNVTNPNTTILSDGSAAWTGDADLQRILLNQSGVTINSINASSITFDFVPKSSNFNFKFLFASEEYGTSQCNYSDAFAFLLKDLTVVGSDYINLAIVPSTTLPISVATIRNSLYGPMTGPSNNIPVCPSENASLFGRFNTPTFGPAFDFNGQTVALTALANLDKTHRYRIKIVIADGNNNTGNDSAIFLEANSFNIGQFILPVSDLTGVCTGNTLPTITADVSNLATGTTYSWKDETGSTISGQTASSLNLNNLVPLPSVGLHTYTITYSEPSCSPIEDDINVTIVNAIGSVQVPTAYACTSAAAANITFDLSIQKQYLINGPDGTPGTFDDLPSGTTINFFTSAALANGNVPANFLPMSYSVPNAIGTTTLIARVSGTSCSENRSCILQVIAPRVIASAPLDMSVCARNTTDIPLKAVFMFAANSTLVLGTQTPATTTITFHTSQADADAGINQISTAYLTSDTTVYVRVESKKFPGQPASCYVTASFNLTVKPLPLVDNTIPLANVIVCNSYILPTLTQAGATYQTATAGGGSTLAVGDSVVPPTPGAVVTIWAYNVGTNGCTNQKSFTVTRVDINAVTPATASYCRNFTLPNLPYGNYYRLLGGPSPTNVALTPAQRTLTSTTTLYVWFKDLTVPIATPCELESAPFTITIDTIVPFDRTLLRDLASCTSVVLVANTEGGTYYTAASPAGSIITTPRAYTSSQTIYLRKTSGVCIDEIPVTITISTDPLRVIGNITECSSYTLPVLTFAGTGFYTAANAGGTPIPSGTIIPVTRSLYYHENRIPGCATNVDTPFTVTILTTPLPAMPSPGSVCDIYLIPALSTFHNGNYYKLPGGPGVSGQIVYPIGTPITTLGLSTIYFNDSSVPGCSLESSFTVTIYRTPSIDATAVEVIKCNESYLVPTPTNGNYYANSGGLSPTNPRINGNTLTTSQTIWINNTGVLPNICVNQYSVSVVLVSTIVDPINVIGANANRFSCNTYTLPALTGTVSGLEKYYKLPGGPLVAGQVNYPVLSSLSGATIGYGVPVTVYIYSENNARVPCSDEKTFTITILQTPTLATQAPIASCDTYTLNAPPAGVTNYFSLSGGLATAGNTILAGGTVINATQTIFAVASIGSGTPASNYCKSELPVLITINRTPILPVIAPQYACNTYTLPAAYVAPITKYYSSNPITPTTELALGSTILASTTIYAFANTNTTPDCVAALRPISITVTPTPVVATILAVSSCDNYVLPAYPTNVTGYYTLSGGLTTTGNVALLPGSIIAATQNIYYVNAVGTLATAYCFDEKILVITINTTPVISTIAPIQACDTYTLLPYTTYGPTTRYYSSNVILPANEVAEGSPITASTTVYAYADTGTTPNCVSVLQPIVITINNTPVIPPTSYAPVAVCNSYTLPILTVGSYYTATNGPLGTGSVKNAGDNIVAPNSTLYVYAATNTTPNNCISEHPFTIDVFNVDVIANGTYCNFYDLPALTNGAYFGASGGLFPIAVGTRIVASQPVYIYGTSPLSTCTDETLFTVTIIYQPTINSIPILTTTTCDTDGVNDGITSFNLVSLNATILGTTQIEEPTGPFKVRYYANDPDAAAELNPIGPLTTLADVIVRVDNTTAVGSGTLCNGRAPIHITVNMLPEPTPQQNGIICFDVTGNNPIPFVLNSGLNPSNYTFIWSDATPAVIGNSFNLSVSIPGIYTVVAQDNVTGCSSKSTPATVLQSQPAVVEFIISDAFSGPQSIEVLATGTGGNYEYQLENGAWQDSPLFENVPFGVHTVTVRDKNGCGSTINTNAIVVNYLNYFIADGTNRWNITTLNENAIIYIFDRYGKLVHEIFPKQEGWDGNFNGTKLPASDYWFTVKYEEDGVQKEFKSHFAMKR